MIEAFQILQKTYASREITFTELQTIEASGIVHFENNGISRTKPSCLFCEVICSPLEELLDKIVATTFTSVEEYDKFMEPFAKGLLRTLDPVDNTLIYHTKEPFLEIIASIDEDKHVICEREDIEVVTKFGIYLPISC